MQIKQVWRRQLFPVKSSNKICWYINDLINNHTIYICQSYLPIYCLLLYAFFSKFGTLNYQAKPYTINWLIFVRFLTHYEVLGIPKTATKAEIKKAYLDKAKECHPDVNPDNDEAAIKFQQVLLIKSFSNLHLKYYYLLAIFELISTIDPC